MGSQIVFTGLMPHLMLLLVAQTEREANYFPYSWKSQQSCFFFFFYFSVLLMLRLIPNGFDFVHAMKFSGTDGDMI